MANGMIDPMMAGNAGLDRMPVSAEPPPMGGGNDDEFPLSYDAKLDGVAYGADTSPAGERFNTFNEFAIKIVKFIGNHLAIC